MQEYINRACRTVTPIVHPWFLTWSAHVLPMPNVILLVQSTFQERLMIVFGNLWSMFWSTSLWRKRRIRASFPWELHSVFLVLGFVCFEGWRVMNLPKFEHLLLVFCLAPLFVMYQSVDSVFIWESLMQADRYYRGLCLAARTSFVNAFQGGYVLKEIMYVRISICK